MSADTLDRIRADCAGDRGHANQVKQIRLQAVTEARRRLERLQNAESAGFEDCHNAARAAAETQEAEADLADAERRWAEVKDL